MQILDFSKLLAAYQALASPDLNPGAENMRTPSRFGR